MKYRKTIVISIGLLALLGGAYLWRSGGEAESSYREARVERGDIEVAVLAAGVVQPRNRLGIKPPIAGRVEEVLVPEGKFVRKGDVLAWMSSNERAALLDAARAKGAEELKRWEELYRATPILAPLDGTLILRNAEPGQSFTLQDDAIFVMSDRLVVRAHVDETDIASIRLRQRASITVDAYPEHALAGTVEQIAFDAKTVNNVTTYEVDVLPEKTPAFMRSGMTVNVSFVVQTQPDVLWLPAEALRTREGRTQVLVPAAQTDATPIEVDIETGLSDGRRVEITAGLEEGSVVLVPRLAKPASASGRSNPLNPYRRR
jgi:macrolide-specific efflux system membrane fusion protein